jgi:DNA-binding response OmpR family regulator
MEIDLHPTAFNRVNITSIFSLSPIVGSTQRTQGKKVLILGESLDSRLFYRSVLQFEGFDVVEANPGPEALRLLAQRKDIAVVLLDLEAPLGWGTFEMKRMSRLKHNRGIKIFVVSDCLERDSITESLNAGADDYLIKGCDPDLLVHKVRKLLGTCHKADQRCAHTTANLRASVEKNGETLPVLICQLSERELQMESKIAIPDGIHLTIKSMYLGEVMGKSDLTIHARTSGATKRNGRHHFDCEIIGMPENIRSQIRTLVEENHYLSDALETIH